MPLYRVLAKSFINNSIVEEGAEVEYDGKPGATLELIESDKDRAKREKAELAEAEAKAKAEAEAKAKGNSLA